MELCSIELNYTYLLQFVKNIDLLKRIFENKAQVQRIFHAFPFNQLLNITILDVPTLTLSIKVIEFFMAYDEFWTSEPLNNTVHFMLLNLNLIKEDSLELSSLLELLLLFLTKSGERQINETIVKSLNPDALLEVLSKSFLQIDTLHRRNYEMYHDILKYLLNMPQCISSTSVAILLEFFVRFKKLNATKTLCNITHYFLKNYLLLLSENCHVVFDWLTGDLLSLIDMNENDLFREMLEFLMMFYSFASAKETELLQKYNIDSNTLYSNLFKLTSILCLRSEDNDLRPICFKVLKMILFSFFRNEKVRFFNNEEIARQLNKFSQNVENWPNEDNDLFFCICHITITNGSTPWQRNSILQAIARCFYQRKQYTKIFILKSIFYLFPMLITQKEPVSPALEMVGDDLLIYFSKLRECFHIYSFTIPQLKWILTRGDTELKQKTLLQWLENIDEDKIIEAIQICNAETAILELVIQKQESSTKLASVFRKLKSPQISRSLALMIPLVADNCLIINNLLLMQPEIPEDVNKCILICSVMGAILPNLSDRNVLRGACIFSRKLLASLKNYSSALLEFSRNMSNIGHLLDISGIIDEETAVEILKLLKMLVKLQRRNNVSMCQKLVHNGIDLLDGPKNKVALGIELLLCIFSSSNCFIDIDKKSIFGVYHKLVNLAFIAQLQNAVHMVVSLLIKKYSYLATSVTTSIHIEMICLSTGDAANFPGFLNLIDVWLKSLLKEAHNGFCPIQESAIRSLLIRSTPTPEKYLRVLEILLKRQDKHSNCKKTHFSLFLSSSE